MDSTQLATWIQAIGSAGSLIALASWVGMAVRTRRDEQEERFAREARTVATWLDEGRRHDKPDIETVVCVSNGGDTPVYDCAMTIPSLERQGKDATLELNVIPPRTIITPPAPDDVHWVPQDDTFTAGVAPELEFTDSSGRRWRRDRWGVLDDLGKA